MRRSLLAGALCAGLALGVPAPAPAMDEPLESAVDRVLQALRAE